MWNVRSCVDIRVFPDIPQSVQRTVSQVQQGSVPRALRHLGLTAGPRCPVSWGRLEECSLHAESARAWRTPGPGLPGPAAPCNAQQLATVNIPAEALSLMGNPTRDLFIQTISELFVALASHKGATSRSDIISSSFGSSMPVRHFDYMSNFTLHHFL